MILDLIVVAAVGAGAVYAYKHYTSSSAKVVAAVKAEVAKIESELKAEVAKVEASAIVARIKKLL